MNDLTKDSYPIVAWTWRGGKGGLLRTQVFADGQIWQERQSASDGSLSPQKLGVITATDATMLLNNCRTALKHAPASPPAVPDAESYELMVSESAG